MATAAPIPPTWVATPSAAWSTTSFLSYSAAQGNDLSTPVPAYGFPGLRPGDHWCVCAARWLEAYEDGMAPPVRLEASELSTLEVIPLEVLRGHAA